MQRTEEQTVLTAALTVRQKTRRAVAGLAITLLAGLAVVSTAAADQASIRIVGGTTTTVEQAPWQVAIFDKVANSFCGGSILDATHILTAAHCATVAENSNVPRPASQLTVWAGTSNIAAGFRGEAAPAGTQVSAVASLRIHPGYPGASTHADDVAVFTLAKALDLSGPRAKPIALAPVGAPPADGTVLRATGFGQQDPAGVANPDGALYVATMTAINDDDCRGYQGSDGAVILCAVGSPASTCFGDSGGPLTTNDAAPVLVGVVSYGGSQTCGNGPDGFADVTVPEIRSFIDGAASLPIAPRLTSPPSLNGVNPPVQGSPLTCQPGAWSGGPSLGYVFKTDAAPSEVLQSGPSAVFVPGPTTVGKPIVCVAVASNAGGTASARSGTAPAIQPDTVKPRSLIRSTSCKRRRCTITVQAADANSLGALSLSTTISYHKRVSCRKHGRRTKCTKTSTRKVNVRQIDKTTYRGTIKDLPYQRLKVTFRVSDAAGNRATTRTKSVTMRRR